MNSNDYFTAITVKSDKLFDYLFFLPKDNIPWIEHFGFDAFYLDPLWIQQDKALSIVNDLYPIKQIGLLKVDPNSVYDWHRDSYRLSSLNMLISYDHISHCLFGEHRSIEESIKPDGEAFMIDIVELKYKPATFYIFNTQKYHCVINFEQPRYMFSLYFNEEIDYNLLKQTLSPILPPILP